MKFQPSSSRNKKALARLIYKGYIKWVGVDAPSNQIKQNRNSYPNTGIIVSTDLICKDKFNIVVDLR